MTKKRKRDNSLDRPRTRSRKTLPLSPITPLENLTNLPGSSLETERTFPARSTNQTKHHTIETANNKTVEKTPRETKPVKKKTQRISNKITQQTKPQIQEEKQLKFIKNVADNHSTDRKWPTEKIFDWIKENYDGFKVKVDEFDSLEKSERWRQNAVLLVYRERYYFYLWHLYGFQLYVLVLSSGIAHRGSSSSLVENLNLKK